MPWCRPLLTRSNDARHMTSIELRTGARVASLDSRSAQTSSSYTCHELLRRILRSGRRPRRRNSHAICWHSTSHGALHEPAEITRRFLRDAYDLVRCLTVELEVQFGLRSPVTPLAIRL